MRKGLTAIASGFLILALVTGCGPVILGHSADEVLVGSADSSNIEAATELAAKKCALFNRKARFNRYQVSPSSPYSHEVVFDCVP